MNPNNYHHNHHHRHHFKMTPSAPPLQDLSFKWDSVVTDYLGTTNSKHKGNRTSFQQLLPPPPSPPLHAVTSIEPLAVMQNQCHPSFSASIQQYLSSIRPTWRSLKSAYIEATSAACSASLCNTTSGTEVHKLRIAGVTCFLLEFLCASLKFSAVCGEIKF